VTVTDERRDEDQDQPTVNTPLHGEKRGPLKPLLVTVALFATLALLYWLGVEFLIDAD
jgi:hypothetical protein